MPSPDNEIFGVTSPFIKWPPAQICIHKLLVLFHINILQAYTNMDSITKSSYLQCQTRLLDDVIAICINMAAIAEF